MVKELVTTQESRMNFQLLIKLFEKGFISKEKVKYLFSIIRFSHFKTSVSDEITSSFGFLNSSGDNHFEREKRELQNSLVDLECLDWLKSERSRNYILISLWEEYAVISQSDVFYNFAFIKIIENRCWGNVDINLIVNFIDYCALRHGRESLTKFINLKCSQWHQSVCRVLNSLWIDSDKVIKSKNSEYDWVLKRLHDERIFSTTPSFETNELKSAFIFCRLDLWVSNHRSAEVDLFFIKLKKSWSQKKFRDGVKDKKVLNTYISGESKSKLEKMAKFKGVKLNEVLEEIIDYSYGNWISSKNGLE